MGDDAAESAFCESFDLFSSFDGSKRDAFINRKSGKFQLKFLDSTIVLKQDVKLLGESGVTGPAVWDSSVVLAKFLEINPHLVSGKRCIELGAGCGLAGIAASRLDCNSICKYDCIVFFFLCDSFWKIILKLICCCSDN